MTLLKSIAVLLFIFMSLNSWSQVYDNNTIDIDGEYNSSTDQSKAIEKMRRRLEKQNEIMVQKQIEHVRYMNEIRLMKKLKTAMDKTINSIN